jgi:two-component system, LuxR family, response regulator FixJ
MSNSGTVFIVDDDEDVRSSLSLLLESSGYRAAACGSAQEFLERYAPEQPGCLLLDLRMPGMDGMALQRELTNRHALLPILFITGHGDVPMAVEAMKNGAFDFLQKPFGHAELLERVQRALAADAEARSDAARRDEVQRRYATLTPREREVMAMIVDGRANKVIAIDLGLSERTVEIHRSRVMEKMGTRSVAHLVRLAIALRPLADAG